MPKDERPKPPDMDLVCDNASCGKTFIFTGGEQNFYSDKGLDPPALCKECRTEKKAQQNVTIECEACGNKRIIRKEYIIRFRRKEGPWENPKYCKFCEENPDQVRKMLNKKASAQRSKDFLEGNANHEYQDLFTDQRGFQGKRILREAKLTIIRLFLHAGIRGGMSVAVLIELQQSLIERGMQSLKGVPSTEYENIMVKARAEERKFGYKEITLKQHIWGDDNKPGLVGHRKEFDKRGIKTFEDAVQTIDNILSETDPTIVVEVMYNGRIKRFDLSTGLFVPASEYNDQVIRPHTAFFPSRGLDYFMQDIKVLEEVNKHE